MPTRGWERDHRALARILGPVAVRSGETAWLVNASESDITKWAEVNPPIGELRASMTISP